MNFDYKEAFSRNLGLLTPHEQDLLKSKKVAIAGMGGVGGVHLQTLARMGISNFHIADMDVFELANFNRQAGAMVSTLHLPKADVLKRMAEDINPECKITVFSEGVTDENMEAFLDGVDVYVDGLDFFVLDVRARLFEKCREKGIPAVTVGPIGISSACLIFHPKGMSFEDYFQFKGCDPVNKAIRFLVGLSPRLPQKQHFVDLSYVSLKEQKGASLSPACMSCAAVAGVEVFKILLGRGRVYYVPWALQFDLYKNRYHKVYNFLGNKNPVNRFKIKILQKLLLR